jgi:chromosome segregation ATPase
VTDSTHSEQVITALATEIDRLHGVVFERDAEIATLRAENNDSAYWTNRARLAELRERELGEMLQERDSEIARLRISVAELEAKLENREEECHEYERILKRLESNLSRANGRYRELKNSFRETSPRLAGERQELECQLQERDREHHHLLQLLATACGDGGHYAERHGVEAACKHAIERVSQLQAEADTEVTRLREALAFYAEPGHWFDFMTAIFANEQLGDSEAVTLEDGSRLSNVPGKRARAALKESNSP